MQAARKQKEGLPFGAFFTEPALGYIWYFRSYSAPPLLLALVEANTSGLQQEDSAHRVWAVGITKMTTEHRSLQNEQITRNFKSKFKSNEGLKVLLFQLYSCSFPISHVLFEASLRYYIFPLVNASKCVFKW